mmetsp:Transcript_20119/g.37614  ORF Transcript_20119/g.37614 Transcript_20119/m.37614 type:complete len:131 (-) Transcript_20119:1404-1796(-)
MTPNDYDDAESYEMIEIGEVVSKNVETDSLIFEITNPYMIGKVDPLKLLPLSGLADHALRLPEPSANPLPPPKNTKNVLYGAIAEVKLAASFSQAKVMPEGSPRKATLESLAEKKQKDRSLLSAIAGPFT